MQRPTKPSPRPSAGRAKQFSKKQWDGSKSGEKILIYGETGMGKTTLASMAPNPVFIGLDDGGRKIRHPKTGELLWRIEDANGNGPETFEDVRVALDTCLTLDCDTVVIDTITLLQSPIAEDYIFRTVPTRDDKNRASKKAETIEDYGWGKGYKHLWDAMRLPILPCEKLTNVNKNIIVIAQLMCHKLYNDAGQEYLKEGPQLYHSEKNWSILKTWTEWVDHIFRIRPLDKRVLKDNKKAISSTERVIDTFGDNTFYAKNRGDALGGQPVSFKTKDDDSLWTLLFNKGE